MSIRFYFEYFPDGRYSNDLCVRCDDTFRALRTSSHIDIKLRPAWLTDEVCDRIGKQLASDRAHWAQFVVA